MLLGGTQPLVTSSLRFENTASAWKKKIDFYKPSKHFLLFFSPTEAWTRVCVGLSLWFIRAGGLGWCVYTGYTSLSFCLCASDKQYFFSLLSSSLSLHTADVSHTHTPRPPIPLQFPLLTHTHTHWLYRFQMCAEMMSWQTGGIGLLSFSFSPENIHHRRRHTRRKSKALISSQTTTWENSS